MIQHTGMRMYGAIIIDPPDLQPAQGGFVEFTFAVPGQYPFVTHKLASASKGAVGMFQAGEVATP